MTPPRYRRELGTWPSICNKSRILYSYEGQCVLDISHTSTLFHQESPQEKSRRLYDHQIYDESLAHIAVDTVD